MLLYLSAFALDVDPRQVVLEEPILALPLVNAKDSGLDVQALILLLNPLNLLLFLGHLIIELLDVVRQFIFDLVELSDPLVDPSGLYSRSTEQLLGQFIDFLLDSLCLF